MAYARAVKQFFDWCDERQLKLADIEAITIATYIGTTASKPTVKQHLAAIRQLFDYLTTGGFCKRNFIITAAGCLHNLVLYVAFAYRQITSKRTIMCAGMGLADWQNSRPYLLASPEGWAPPPPV